MTRTQRRRPRPSTLYAIKQVELVVRSKLDELAKPYGITAIQYTALTVLDRAESPLSQAELARLSFVRPQSMSDVLAGLLRRGLIERRADESNRRRLHIVLTGDGQALVADLAPANARLEQRMLRGLDASQRREFADSLALARRNLSAES